VSDAGLHRTIPALPVRDVRAAAEHYRERFGFVARHLTDGLAVLDGNLVEFFRWNG
jgi:hypothetical protein